MARATGNGRIVMLALVVSATIFGLTAILGPRMAAGTVLATGPQGSVRAAWVDDQPVWVVSPQDGRQPHVLDAVNPHRWWGIKELVGWCPGPRIFNAYYDASRFDEAGNFLLGPAPRGLDRFEVTDAGGGKVRVGQRVASQGRAGSEWEPTDGNVCFSEAGIPPVVRPEEPMAEYHDRIPSTHEMVEGALVVNAQGGTFCSALERLEPLLCEGDAFPVPQVVASEELGVHHGRFAVRRRGNDLLDVIALPGGYMEYPNAR